MIGWLGLALVLFPVLVQAAPWEFGAPLDVEDDACLSVFHQLNATGRQHLAVSGRTVALVWEDNRSGSVQAYVAFKPVASEGFTSARRVSSGVAAADPVIAALGADRFLIAWEQDGAVWVRRADATAFGTPLKLADNAAQVSLGAANRVYAAWSEVRDGFSQIRIAHLLVNQNGEVRIVTTRGAQDSPATADQFYPSIAVTTSGALIAWEDRRRGHTVLFYSALDAAGHVMPARILNDQLSRSETAYGKGTGVARVALTPYGRDAVAAVWLDKRDLENGYDVYFARTTKDGKTFGPNQKVQDEFGSRYSQWHAAIAGHVSGRLAVVWDDDRDDSADLWLAWPTKDGWSENLAVPGASGPGQQSQPSATLDAAGDLHLAWVERDAPDSPTRLRYLHAPRASQPASSTR
jgi:hypothetical protein